MTSPPIGTDEELIERWNRTSDLEGNVSDICNAGDALADALQSRISEVERLRERVEYEISAWAFNYDIDGATRNDLLARIRAALSQHRTTG